LTRMANSGESRRFDEMMDGMAAKTVATEAELKPSAALVPDRHAATAA
jgi:hypothetical protein